MPQIIFSDTARTALFRLADFIAEVEPALRKRMTTAIVQGIQRLETFPRIAKPCQNEKHKDMRELFIPFGRSGYVVLYEYIESNDVVLINAIRHTREAGYKTDNS